MLATCGWRTGAAAYYDELENPTLPRYAAVYGGFAMAVGFVYRRGGPAPSAPRARASSSTLRRRTSSRTPRARWLVSPPCTYPCSSRACRGPFDIAKVSPANQEKQRTPATVAMVALTVLAGIKITDLGFICAFGGAILGSAIIYVIPSQIALSACKKGKLALGGAEKLACRSINVMGYVLAVLGGTASVLSRMGKI